MFSEEQLNAWGQHHRKAKNNLALLFFYFAEEKTLVSVDIDTLLNTKLNKLYIEDIQSMGYLILGWENFYRYFDAMLNFKGHRPRRRGKCAHYWVLESQDEAFKRSRSRKYSMGPCAIRPFGPRSQTELRPGSLWQFSLTRLEEAGD